MDIESYSIAAKVEEKHWWFYGRRALINKVLKKNTNGILDPVEILEVGCGNGGNLALLSTFGNVSALEMDDNARLRAESRKIAKVEKGWLPDNVPYQDNTFDIIAVLDVIEHIDDDDEALAVLSRILKPDGLLVLTAPAFEWLWSLHDEKSHHKRRYVLADLREKIINQGFRSIYCSYFNTLLFPISFLFIVLSRILRFNTNIAFKIPNFIINSLLKKIFLAESLVVPAFSLPFGVSIIVCARKLDD